MNIDELRNAWNTYDEGLDSKINLDLLNKLVVSLTAHRDYKWDQWWLQTGIAFRISKVKKPKETFPN